MAERKPIYLDFESGQVREMGTGDTIDETVATNVGGASTFVDLTDGPGEFTGQAGKFVKVNAGATQLEYAALAGGGDLLSTNNLSDVANAATARTNLGIATTANQTDSANKRFVTDAQLTVIGNTSGTNTGDQTLPVKATGAEVDTGTDDAKFVTAKAMEDSSYIKAAYADAKVADAINDGTTTIAPSQNAVFDALASKAIDENVVHNSGDETITGTKTFSTLPLGVMPRGHIWGLIMSNAADTVNDITVAAGEARSESHTGDMILAAAITKQLDAAWAVGTNAGGLNTGAVANSTWYEVHLIKRVDTGVVDVMFTTTANRATLPANYTLSRRIGWIVTQAAGAGIRQFTQINDHFTLVTPVNDVSATATASATTRTLTAPPNSIARCRAACLGNTSVNAANGIVFSEIVETDTAPTTTNGFLSIGAGDFAIMGSVHMEIRVSSTSTIRDRAITATGSMAYDISTFGWIDHRLRLSNT